jgi:solute carrier family 26 (sodium-independent sulfate anion transporter), member 11
VTDNGEKVSPNNKLHKFENWLQSKSRNLCTKKVLYKRLPILKWLPNYNSEDAIGDLVAGITVGLTVIPQALAYSGIAGLPAAVSPKMRNHEKMIDLLI